MQIITLYRYQRPEGGVTVSPVMPEGVEYTTKFRLIADEGKILVNGDIMTGCTDVDSEEGWSEIDAPEENNKE